MHMETWSQIPSVFISLSDAFLAQFLRTPLHHSVLLSTWPVLHLLHKSITAGDGVTWVPHGLVSWCLQDVDAWQSVLVHWALWKRGSEIIKSFGLTSSPARSFHFPDIQCLIHIEDSSHWPQLPPVVFTCVNKLEIRKIQARFIKRTKTHRKVEITCPGTDSNGTMFSKQCSLLGDPPFCPSLFIHFTSAKCLAKWAGILSCTAQILDRSRGCAELGKLW